VNKELKDKWVEALRSDQYPQGSHVLRNKAGGFCCLGVLCDLIDPQGWADQSLVVGTGHEGYVYRFGDSGAVPFLPKELQKQYFYDGVQDYHIHVFLTDLAAKNDAGLSFAHIATLIEESELL
jgi:hypothetical protein